MIVLEHTNPLSIYLDYHYWLPERGASGDMTGGEYSRLTSTGPFNSCNPRPIGDPGLGSPLTKNKSTFSDYHNHAHNEFTDAACAWHFGGSYSGSGTERGMFAMLRYYNIGAYNTIGSRLSKIP